MAKWQYAKKAVVPTDQGYFVQKPATRADHTDATGYLKDQDDQHFYLWIHDITGSFEVSGQAAQSERSRSWYPRYMTQPRLTVHGQTANQHEHARLTEFVRVTQDKSLRFERSAKDFNTVTLGINGHTGLKTQQRGQQYSREPILVQGHIKSIERRTERYVNAPEFQFEFIVAFSSMGLYTIEASEIDKLPKWMDIVENKGTFAPDPDYTWQPAPLVPGIGGQMRT